MQILSIQSHVTYGHVGNAAIQLPLQQLGVHVLPIHTALLSSHTGYNSARGPVVPADDLRAIVDGLEAIGMLQQCDAVLSGYLGSAATGAVVLDAVDRVKRANPAALFCCDPVIGDRDEGMYVTEGVRRFISDTAIAAADIITPNQYELGILVDRQVRTDAEVAAACAELHARGPKWVLGTSLHLVDAPTDQIEMQLHGPGERWRIRTPFEQVAPTVKGTGDLVAALFTTHLLQTKEPQTALENATAGVFAALAETARVGATELRLVAAQNLIRHPPRSFRATTIN